MSASPQPHRYHQVYLALRQRITAGVYSRNALIPGERDLAEEFGVARVTVRAALSALERENLVLREQGRGTIVLGPENDIPSKKDETAGFDLLFDSILTMGLRTKVAVIDLGATQAPNYVAQILGTDPQAVVFRVIRVRFLDHIPVSYSAAWMAPDLAQGLTKSSLTARPLLTLLSEQGIQINKADESISACAADIDIAAALNVAIGSPLLWVRRVAFDRNGAAVLFFDGQFRPEHYRYHLQLSQADRTSSVMVKLF
jgi:GntR family transcriptional regulator